MCVLQYKVLIQYLIVKAFKIEWYCVKNEADVNPENIFCFKDVVIDVIPTQQSFLTASVHSCKIPFYWAIFLKIISL